MTIIASARSLLCSNYLVIAALMFLIPAGVLFCCVHEKRINVIFRACEDSQAISKFADLTHKEIHSSSSEACAFCSLKLDIACSAPKGRTASCLVVEQAEQNTPAVAQNVEPQLWPDIGAYDDSCEGLAASWGDDIVSNLCSNCWQLVARWHGEIFDSVLASINLSAIGWQSPLTPGLITQVASLIAGAAILRLIAK